MFRLLVEAWSNAVRQVTVSGWTRQDKAIDEFTLTTTADRAKSSETKDIVGWPDYLEVATRSVGVRRGELFARVSFYAGGTKVRLLCSGYITDGRPLTIGVTEGFTDGPGLIRTVVGTDPAVDTEISETVPTNARWRLRAMKIILVTDVNVANRGVTLNMDDGTNAFVNVPDPVNHAASETRVYSYLVGGEYKTGTRGTMNNMLPLPDVFLGQGYRVRTVTSDRQAGDNYAAPVMELEEWIEE